MYQKVLAAQEEEWGTEALVVSQTGVRLDKRPTMINAHNQLPLMHHRCTVTHCKSNALHTVQAQSKTDPSKVHSTT